MRQEAGSGKGHENKKERPIMLIQRYNPANKNKGQENHQHIKRVGKFSTACSYQRIAADRSVMVQLPIIINE